MTTMTAADQEKTGLGNYFIANYPPFSFWKPHVPAGRRAAPRLAARGPACRSGCTCTSRSAGSGASSATSASTPTRTPATSRSTSTRSSRKSNCSAKTACVGGRPLDYVYFGGGTPSYLSAAQLDGLMTRLRQIMPWDAAREVTFECEPGTLQQHKLETLRKHGVTRLSLGVENFKPEILQFNGRAHLEEEIYRAYGWARELGFPQINIDLIAGMVGEDWDNWQRVRPQDDRARSGQRDDLPDGVAVQHGLLEGTEGDRQRRADAGRRRLADQAGVDEVRLRRVREGRLRDLERHHGGEGQGEDAVRLPRSLWHGADMFGTGVASFGHVNGVHIQNVDTWEQYIEKLNAANCRSAAPSRPPSATGSSAR